MDVQFTRPYLVRGDRKQSSQPGNAADKDDRITNLLAYDTCRITIGGACKKQSSLANFVLYLMPVRRLLIEAANSASATTQKRYDLHRPWRSNLGLSN